MKSDSRKIALAAALLACCFGCTQDPKARTQKFFDSGMHYEQKSKYPEAAIQFQNAIQIDKNFAAAHYQLARVLLQQGLWSNAYRELLTTIDLQPQNWDAQQDLANLLFGAHQFQQAKDRAQAILKDNPNYLNAQLLLASADAELGNLPAGLREAQQAVQMAPDKPGPYLTLALFQERAKQLSEAEQSYTKAKAVDPKSFQAHLQSGGFYGRQHHWSEAEAEYRKSIELDPKSPIARASLAGLFMASGKKDQAEDTLKQAKLDLPDDANAYRLLGDFYVANADIAKALPEFASLVKQHPHDAVSKKRYVQLLTQSNQLGEALKLDEEILKANSRDSEALVLKGRLLNLLQTPALAVPALESAVRSSSENPEAHFELGLSYQNTGNLEGAEKEFRAAVKLRPSLLQAQQQLANIALKNGNMELLDQCASAWLRYAPGAPQGYVMKGTSLLSKRDASGAEQDLQRAITLDPKNAIAYARLADVRVLQGRFADAEGGYEKALALDSNTTEALQNLTNLLMAQKHSDKALSRVQEQLAKAPNNATYHFLFGQLLLSRRDSDQGQAELKKAIELDKTSMAPRFVLARAEQLSGQLEQAAGIYEQMIQDYPKDSKPYVGFGLLEEVRGNWQHAEDLYRKALDLEPSEAPAANNLSYLLLEHGGDVNYALSLAQIGRRGMPDSANTADTLAWAYYRNGIYKSAIELLQDAVKKSPNNSTYYYHLGLAYQHISKPLLARQSFQTALRINPNSTRADEIRQALAEVASN
jgi:tetratricopeptide (TPR) repeat protein